jgi:hypothetical protein
MSTLGEKKDALGAGPGPSAIFLVRHLFVRLIGGHVMLSRAYLHLSGAPHWQPEGVSTHDERIILH